MLNLLDHIEKFEEIKGASVATNSKGVPVGEYLVLVVRGDGQSTKDVVSDVESLFYKTSGKSLVELGLPISYTEPVNEDIVEVHFPHLLF